MSEISRRYYANKRGHAFKIKKTVDLQYSFDCAYEKENDNLYEFQFKSRAYKWKISYGGEVFCITDDLKYAEYLRCFKSYKVRPILRGVT